jgi:hypothetical protein
MLHHNKTAKSKPKREQTINESLTPNKTTEQSRTKGEPGFDSQNKLLCFQWLIKKFINYAFFSCVMFRYRLLFTSKATRNKPQAT